MSVCIVMCTYRNGKVSEAHDLWGDLRVTAWSLEAYIPKDIQIHIAWDGPAVPDAVPDAPNFHYYERPKGLGLAAAMNWLIEQTDTDAFVIVPDDAVLHPDAWSQLLEDVAAIQNLQGVNLGIVGTRCNFVVGPQNIRSSNGGSLLPNNMFFDSEDTIFQVETVYPVVAWFSREAYEKVGRFPDDLHWFGDVLYSYDLRANDYQCWVSRAYVHHIGMRGTRSGRNASDEQLCAEGLKWLRKNRPDFYETLRFA